MAAAAGAAPGYTAVPTQPQYAAQPMAANPGLSDNAAAAIAYLTIIPAIVFLVLEPYNRIPLVKFHSWQSIGFFIGAMILQVALSMTHILLHFIPLIWLLFALIELALSVGLFILWIIVILKASKGEWYKLPVIGDFAMKQAQS
jgi:uncharacterized membrane protein